MEYCHPRCVPWLALAVVPLPNYILLAYRRPPRDP
ncbi:hypothetical protein CGRA01v4_02874 [Colletotrichum graminicola]|nr:hypothetical protein CGRA01v4_02874 [Colletotrichum graminicola]